MQCINLESLHAPSQPGDRYRPSRIDSQMDNQCRMINKNHSSCLKTAAINRTVTGPQELIELSITIDRVELCVTKPSKKHI